MESLGPLKCDQEEEKEEKKKGGKVGGRGAGRKKKKREEGEKRKQKKRGGGKINVTTYLVTAQTGICCLLFINLALMTHLSDENCY